jgi:hypothetical protein
MASMAPWIDDSRLEDWEKQDIWDMIVEEHPMMEHSPIFEAGYDNWDPFNEKNLKSHERWASLLNKGISHFQPGQTLGGSAIDYLNTIKIEPEEDREEEDLMSLLAHEIPHLGMRLDTERKHLFNPFGMKARIEKEENLNRMHDLLYQPSSYMASQKAIPNLMDRGYIEQTNIPGGLSYSGEYGTQWTPSGNEFIRESGLPKHYQRALGYVEPSRSTNQAPVRSTPTRDPNEGRHHFNTGGIVSLAWQI